MSAPWVVLWALTAQSPTEDPNAQSSSVVPTRMERTPARPKKHSGLILWGMPADPGSQPFQARPEDVGKKQSVGVNLDDPVKRSIATKKKHSTPYLLKYTTVETSLKRTALFYIHHPFHSGDHGKPIRERLCEVCRVGEDVESVAAVQSAML